MKSIKLSFDKKRWPQKFPYLLSQYRFVRYKRKCEIYRERKITLPLFILYRFIFQCYKIRYLTDIPASTEIGGGFKIEHLGNIVINPKAKIGEKVTILNGVLIGQQNRGRKQGCPTIGNKVWIGTNAIVVGAIHIGNNVLIAPGAYINFDVPDNSIVLGNPGTIISKQDATDSYITTYE